MFGGTSKRKVTSILKRHSLLRKYTVLTDITLPHKDGDVTLGNLMIGNFGVLFVDTYSYKGDLYGGESDATWALHEKDYKTPVPNPLKERERKVEALRDVFSKEQIFKVELESCIVFTASEKKLMIYSPVKGLLRPAGLKKMLSEKRFDRDIKQPAEKIVTAIEAHAIGSKH